MGRAKKNAMMIHQRETTLKMMRWWRRLVNPVEKERQQVIQKQGLSPRCPKKKNDKGKEIKGCQKKEAMEQTEFHQASISLLVWRSVTDAGYTGTPFTWCNGWKRGRRISKRLDRVLFNDEWAELFSTVRVDHLPRTSSDHNILLMRCANNLGEVNRNIQGNTMWILQQKLKITAKNLSYWSRNNIGNVHDKVREIEQLMKQKEDGYECDDSDQKRQAYHKAHAEYIMWLKRQKSILKQKSRTDRQKRATPIRNTFIIRGRDGECIEGEKEIAEAAIEHFGQIFTQPNNSPDLSITNLCGKVISEEDKDKVQESPTEEEIKEDVFSMEPNSAAVAWQIVKKDLIAYVQALFGGAIGATSLKLRTISLCNFTNKILSKIVALRLATLLPKMISENHSGFVRGRLIIENILLTQEIVQGIRKQNQRGNLVGFIEMVYRLISNNWYSIIQGDPLSLALFIIAAEINHLCYADDLAIFTSGDRRPIKMIMDQLSKYKISSGQEINQDKSQFYTQEGIESHIRKRIKRWTGYKQAYFLFTYLGCPIYIGRKKICHFTEISNKVMNKAGGWQGRFLSKRGRAIIIKYILQSQTTHLLAALVAPKAVLDQIEMTEDTLWAKFMKAKYCIRSNIMSKGISPTDSMAWKHLVKIRDKVEVNIMWKINEGNLLFWWDDWTSQASTKHLLYLSLRSGSTKVKDFTWGMNGTLRSLAGNIIQGVALGDFMARDLAIWKPSTNGIFSCTTVIQAPRQKRALTPFLSKLWSLNHVFVKCEMAKKIWEATTRPLGIYYRGNTVEVLLGKEVATWSWHLLNQFLTNNYNEVQAALFGLTWCCRQSFNHLTLEMDSLILSAIGQIQELVQHRNITVVHCYREGNADSVLYLREEDMETEIRAHMRMDALKIAGRLEMEDVFNKFKEEHGKASLAA
ncbi:hypothetical protein A4A49_51111 [Nicotiana attenuata]|uniref:Uncharacterized protein n=1 Tax=Nicotiana attenuata TaxID=49451 RepID=A0A1J6I1J6_NICAT|nr:hypothetical protein A4A49_51111 [Nicotiana attenuata]